MTHLLPADDHAVAAPITPGSLHTTPLTSGPALDRAQLHAGIARRRAALANLEAALVAACEQAAARGAPRFVRVDDRATWDRAMWQRYLDAAARLEPGYGPRMRRLLREIDRLTRLIALPVVG